MMTALSTLVLVITCVAVVMDLTHTAVILVYHMRMQIHMVTVLVCKDTQVSAVISMLVNVTLNAQPALAQVPTNVLCASHTPSETVSESVNALTIGAAKIVAYTKESVTKCVTYV